MFVANLKDGAENFLEAPPNQQRGQHISANGDETLGLIVKGMQAADALGLILDLAGMVISTSRAVFKALHRIAKGYWVNERRCSRRGSSCLAPSLCETIEMLLFLGER